MAIALGAQLASVTSRPDYNIQPGDEGPYKGDHDHHHHHHHENSDEEELVPPPLTPANVPSAIGKKCELKRETTNAIPGMCFLEPECSQECKQVSERKCTPFQEQVCSTKYVTSCNIVQEEKCVTNYVTQYENQCNPNTEQKCNTK